MEGAAWPGALPERIRLCPSRERPGQHLPTRRPGLVAMHDETILGLVGPTLGRIRHGTVSFPVSHGQPSRLDTAAQSRDFAHSRDLAAGRDQLARAPAENRRVLGALPAYRAGTSQW